MRWHYKFKFYWLRARLNWLWGFRPVAYRRYWQEKNRANMFERFLEDERHIRKQSMKARSL